MKNTIVDAVKDKLDLVDVMKNGQFGEVELQSNGNSTEYSGWHKAHESKSKSGLKVNSASGLWHCHSCGQNGDVISWIGFHERGDSYQNSGEDFRIALCKAAEVAGIPMHDEVDTEAIAERRSLEDIYTIVADFYHAQLEQPHREWLHTRYGLTDETIDELKLGYSPTTQTALMMHLKDQGVEIDDILKTGLVSKNSKTVDLFQGRLIFPYWRRGKPVYFIGRETDDTPKWEKENGMKYRKQMVHNDKHPYVSEQVSNSYFYAEDAARGTDTLFLTEGVTDCIIANQSGVACISPVTVRFSKSDWPRLIDLTKNASQIYIVNDNEENQAGEKGALATAAELWKHGKFIRFIELPRPEGVDKVDLNDYLRTEGVESFNALLSGAKTLLDLKLDEYDAADADYKIVIIRSIFELLAQVDDLFQQTQWRKTIPKRLGIGKGEHDMLLKGAYVENEKPNKEKERISKADPTCMTLLEYEASDGGIADYWLDKYKDGWIFAAGYEIFYTWNETHWCADEDRVLQFSIQQTMIEMHQLAKLGLASCDPDDDDEGGAFKGFISVTKRSAQRVASVTSLIQSYIAVRAADLDTGNILNLKNGTLDLDTYELRPHTPEDNLTYCLPYEYDADADCPRYKQFLFEVLVKEYSKEPDRELCILYQELLGYSLTMDTKHELMVWQAGEGANGKSVATRIIKDLLGPIAMEVDFQILGQPGNYDLSDIPNKRVIFSTEAAKGGRVAENYIKKIVSGESIRTRGIFQKPFEFQSMAKIWWSMNDRPIISDTTNAIWRRLVLIPFYREFTDSEKDENLYASLHAELPGILNFALDGLFRVRENGKFQHSQAVAKAVKEYKRESNPVALWMDEQTTAAGADIEFPTDWTSAKELYADYSLWCQQNGRKPFNATNFGNELKRFKIPKKHIRTGNIYALCIVI